MKARSSDQRISRNRKSKQEPYLSAAYIRSLVSRCAKDPESVGADGFRSETRRIQSRQSEAPPTSPPQQHRKQVRRRVHTSRPYQERLVNMAEARREIVTALKFHRAAMKQANEQQQQSHPSFPPPLDSAFGCSLPSQTLGLNLCHNSNNPPIYSSPSSSSSSSSTLSVAASHEVRQATESYGGGSLHQAVDDEGMAEMRSLGEQHQMEWNDTMNLATSAWWFKLLKKTELGNGLDQAMEFPACLNANDSVLSQHCSLLFPDSCFQGSALPCMDMGEIDGNDGDWHWLA